MKITTWNVNSIRARKEQVLEWLSEKQPDVLLIQEIKCLEDQFPKEEFEDLGYNCVVLGQKTFNGVAILSKFPINDTTHSIPNFDDPQARFIEGEIKGKKFISVYVPNGQSVDSDKFSYKLNFFDHLLQYIRTLIEKDTPFIIGGDFNIALRDEDVFDTERMKGSICFTTIERQKLNHFVNLGLIDTQAYIGHKNFTWWDYRSKGFEANKGLRIDYIFTSAHFSHLLKDVTVDTMARGKEKASDHAPVTCDLSIK